MFLCLNLTAAGIVMQSFNPSTSESCGSLWIPEQQFITAIDWNSISKKKQKVKNKNPNCQYIRIQLSLEIDLKEVIKVKQSHTGGSWFSMLSAWEIRIQTFRRMLDMNIKVDNGPLVRTVSASTVILDSQPAELQGNECCCWSCQPVVIHYGRGGNQGSKEISQHEAFPGDFFLHFDAHV